MLQLFQWIHTDHEYLELFITANISKDCIHRKVKTSLYWKWTYCLTWCFINCSDNNVQWIPHHHLALRIPDIWLWSAKWRKTIRLTLHLRFTPRGLEVITHLLRILTGQLSLGNAAISLSANSCKKCGKFWHQYLFVIYLKQFVMLRISHLTVSNLCSLQHLQHEQFTHRVKSLTLKTMCCAITK